MTTRCAFGCWQSAVVVLRSAAEEQVPRGLPFLRKEASDAEVLSLARRHS